MSGPVRSVSQAFAIMRLLAESRPLSLSDVGRSVGLSPSSCLNLLKTLVDEGAAERDARTKLYRLSPVWASAEALRDGGVQMLVDRALPLMVQLAELSDAAVGLWKIASRDRLQLVAHAESNAGMRLRLADAQRQPLGGGAVGRALAAAQKVDDAELARRYAAVRWQADLSFADYADQVRRTGQAGYAIDQGFAHRGISTVAVAFPEIRPGFGLSASIFTESRNAEEVEALGTDLLRVRATLSPPS